MPIVDVPAIWIQGASCSGDSVSILNGVAPSIGKALLEELVPGKHLNLLFHPTVMAGSGEMVMEILEAAPKDLRKGYVLVIEGAVSTGADGAFCAVGERGDGTPIPFTEHLEKLAKNALAVIAVGDCASFGGIPSTSPNPTGAKGVAGFLEEKGIDTPVVNVSGCPVNPDWFLGTVASVFINGLPGEEDLDPWGRPRLFYGALIHDNCPRRGFFDTAHFAKKPGDEGCLYLLGCKGPITYADCPNRQWNTGTNWCIRAGAPCMGCAEARFFQRFGDVYEKVTEEGWGRLKSAE